MPKRGPVVVDVDSGAVVEAVVEADAAVDTESDGSLDGDDSLGGDDEALESDGSQTATHGVVTTAAPIPSATASAPTRPMYFPLLMPAPSRTRTLGCGLAMCLPGKLGPLRQADWGNRLPQFPATGYAP